MFMTLVVLLLASSTTVWAENRDGVVTVSPFVGGYTFDGDQALDRDWYYGVRIGYNFSEHWGAEGLFGYISAESEASGFEGRGVDVFRYGVDILYNFMPQNNFAPFLAVGIGGSRIDDPSGAFDRDQGMLDYGAGFKYFLSENVALRADIRHDMFYESDNLKHNLEYTFGLFFQFGGGGHVTASSYHSPAQSPEPKAELAYAPRAAATQVILIELIDTHFEFDQSTLTPKGKEVLLQNIETLKANPDLEILVAGYASASGTEEYNQKLSERRATTVRKALIEGGIAPERLWQIGYGESRPAKFEMYPEEIESRAAKSNMRVLFTIMVK